MKGVMGCFTVVGVVGVVSVGLVVLAVMSAAITASRVPPANISSFRSTAHVAAVRPGHETPDNVSGDRACEIALAREKTAADAHGQAEYDAAVSGLNYNEHCDDENAQLVNHGYLLSMKAFAEHDLSTGDWRTDFNQANQLLVECQTKPGLYATRTAASCETQEDNNIHAATNWEMGE